MGFMSNESSVRLATWREKLERKLVDFGEAWEDIEYVYPEKSVLDVPFDDGYGLPEGPEFLVFTTKRIYFPVCYDGAEMIGSVPRHPKYIQSGDGEHQGGW